MPNETYHYLTLTLIRHPPACLERRGTTVQPGNLPDHDCRIYCNGGQVFGEWNFANYDTRVAIRMSGKIKFHLSCIVELYSLVHAAAPGGTA